MKAAYYERLGPAEDVLELGDMPDPQPGPGEIRVRIEVSGLNPSDIKGRNGFKGAMAYQRVVPHQDGAGVIDAVGEGVGASRIGERVWVYEAQSGRAFGTAAEYVVVPQDKAVGLADHVSFETGASLGIPALTAHYCLFADGDLNQRRVLVQGGAGVVGEAAIQLAKWSGAWVAATVRTAADVARVQAAGADLVIDMQQQDVESVLMEATAGAGVDRIVEVDLISNLELDLACLAKGGTISTYSVEAANAKAPVPVLKAMANCAAFRFVLVYTVPEAAKRKAIRDVTACLAEGRYKVTIGKVFPFEAIAEAHDTLDEHRVKGKVLLRVHSGQMMS
ncbi:NADPH:quinone reductase [Pseudomonas sp. NPDC090208]|uniref:NADPH:quinone reductase n=1 Tax=Pseudomonas sp. NPDC090208 TaxID=3364478 RepID=UPI0037FAB1FC